MIDLPNPEKTLTVSGRGTVLVFNPLPEKIEVNPGDVVRVPSRLFRVLAIERQSHLPGNVGLVVKEVENQGV